MNCVNCGKIMLENWLSLLCADCQMDYQKELNFGNPTPKFFEIQNKLISFRNPKRERWDELNPAYARIGQLCRDFPEMVKVLYECACDKTDKLNHHFDYTRPFEVIRLCASCHRKEHSRLNKTK